MTNTDRNIRTIVVCFVLAIMALIPLKIAQSSQINGDSQVLGDTVEKVVLPNAKVDTNVINYGEEIQNDLN